MQWSGIRTTRLSAILGVLLTGYLIILSLQLNQSSGHWLNRLDYLLYDLRYNWSLDWRPRGLGEQPIAIIDIDEQSLAEQGRWPWSRHTLAELVTTLGQYGAVVVAFDVVFSEPERNPVDEVQRRIAIDGETWEVPPGWYRQ
ncbi:MAG: CHASE2 domain-containing protein, partial [Pseudomonadota bacterium]